MNNLNIYTLKNKINKKKLLDRDFRDLCERLYYASSFQEAELTLYYCFVMSQMLGFPLTQVKFDYKNLTLCYQDTNYNSTFLLAMWFGFTEMLSKGRMSIEAATIECFTMSNGRVVSAQIENAEKHTREISKYISYSLETCFEQMLVRYGDNRCENLPSW